MLGWGCGVGVGIGIGALGPLTGAGVGPAGGVVPPPPPGVDWAGAFLGVVRPAAGCNAIGGSKTPSKFDTQVDHAGSNSVTIAGSDNCGVHKLLKVVLYSGSIWQFVVQMH